MILNKPVAWMKQNGEVSVTKGEAFCIPLYTHPHPDNLGWALSIIDQQKLEIEKLKDEVAEWKMSYENCHRMCSGYGMN